MALVEVSKQPNCPKVLTESARSHLGSSGRESQKVSRTVQTLFRTGESAQKGVKRLSWESHSGGPNTPFAPSLSTFGHLGCLTVVPGKSESQCKDSCSLSNPQTLRKDDDAQMAMTLPCKDEHRRAIVGTLDTHGSTPPICLNLRAALFHIWSFWKLVETTP